MSLHLRIHSASERRLRFAESTRSLLCFSQVPDPPTSPGHACEALLHNNRRCRAALPEDRGHPWCDQHYDDLSDLTFRWTQVHHEAEKIVVFSPDDAKQKIFKLRQSVDLRQEIRRQFYPRGDDIQDYIKWIAKLENDIAQVGDTLLMQNLNRGPTPETPGIHTASSQSGKSDPGERIVILRSPLDPKIPIESLQGLPDDGSILILKHFYMDLCADSIRRLYTIVPDLNDSHNRTHSEVQSGHAADDAGTYILRSWFRIMVLNDSEAAQLEYATRSSTIHEYLAGCHASQLEMYCDFFEKAWRPHAVQYLRVAICAQTLAGSELNQIQLLGGTIPSTTEGLRMKKPCWDILYHWFPTLLTPWTIASICSNFDDYTTICTLLMLGLYNDCWYDPVGILNDCSTGVYMGFIPMSKGDYTSHAHPRQEGDVWVQHESRNYLCGQMALGRSMTQRFLDELRKRTATLHLVVYEGTRADATVHSKDPDLFISRHRSASSLNELETAEFTTDIKLEDIKHQLRITKTSVYDPIVVDSWHFIIIDREIGLPFQLMDMVQDVLLLLNGDPTPWHIAKRVIREVIPPSIQEIVLEDIQIECPFALRFRPSHEVQYEGNRYRCHDVNSSRVMARQKKMKPDRDANRFIRYVVEEMERCGIVSLAPEYEEPQSRPVIMRGVDGALDLYFPYKYDEGTASKGKGTGLRPLPAPSCLLDFAQSFQQEHPNAVMAKGSIYTHYCAWPMPTIKSMGKTGTNFATWEGHVYRWNAMPFDRPGSANAWQYCVQHFLSAKLPFVRFFLSTFVICATDAADAEFKMTRLLEEMTDRGWRVALPPIHEWTSDIEEVGLETFYGGIRPA